MTRPYRQRRRADRQAETRLRITEAAVALHGSVGPARTTISMIAEHAGVQRHTVYAHFPDDRSLLMACSGLVEARDPLPDPTPWRDIADPAARLSVGLAAVHGWYARHAALLACVLRDAEVDALTREIVTLRFGPRMAAWEAVLGEGLSGPARAMLSLALSFPAWRILAHQAALAPDAVVALLVQAVLSAARA